MSNTKKITARRKNRREKGIRAEFLGSKPHSKGLDFSRSAEERRERLQAIMKTREGKPTEIKKVTRYKSIPQK